MKYDLQRNDLELTSGVEQETDTSDHRSHSRGHDLFARPLAISASHPTSLPLPHVGLPLHLEGIPRFVAHRAHHYTEEEWKRITAFSSITYLPLHTKIYKHWLQHNWIYREWDHWLMMGLIGFSVGLLGSTLKITIEKIVESKFDRATFLLEKGQFGLTWFSTILVSMALAATSAAIVVFGEPAAGGSGIPEVMAYLNGISIRRIFGGKALIVKFFSCVFAVSAGLYGGQEGPMIHMGAALGKILSQGVTSNRMGGYLSPLTLFKRFRNMYDRRNFISAGAAAGVASAFKAPVGGLLFVLEEISSFWSHKSAWQTFFCCMVSTFTTQAFNSIYQTGSLGSFSGAVFNVEEAINSQLMMFGPTLFVGVIGGLFAALFTWANLKICKWRNANIVPRRWARIAEPTVVAFMTTTLAVLIPYLFDCQSYRCAENPKLPGCTRRYSSSYIEADGLVRYACAREETYNPAASLFFTTGDKTIEQLFSRNTHYQFDYGALSTLLVVYFSMCCYTAGMAPALGTMVPALLIGAVIGRLVGVGITDLVGIRDSQNWAWVDPGGFALIGAAAFFGGLTRLTFTLAVVMIEITDETHFLLPIMTAVMIGKWTADSLIDSLYHNLIELKCLPFLSDEPHVEECLDLHSIEDVMATGVISLPEMGTVAHMAEVLASCEHRALPVVEVTSRGAVFKGIILRNHAFSILAKEALFLDEDNPLVAKKAPSLLLDNDGDGITAVHMEALDVAELVNLDDKMPLTLLAKSEGEKRALLDRLQQPMYRRRFVTLAPYVDQSSYRIPPSFSLERCFNMFRSMGLSHIVVVDKDNEVVGIVTRKDLTNINIHRKLEKLKQREQAERAGLATRDEEQGTGGPALGRIPRSPASDARSPIAASGRRTTPPSALAAFRTSSPLSVSHPFSSRAGARKGASATSRSMRDELLIEEHGDAIAEGGLDQGVELGLGR